MTINTKQLYFILDNTPAEQNIMLMGKHGIGKSRILEDYFSDKKAKVVTLFLGQMSDPGDLIGLPEKNEKTGKTDFMLPYWFPLDDTPIVLFLDELNRARPEVLQTIMDLTLNRKLAGKSLPKGSRIISAVNNGNEYQLTDLDPALVSRFNIYEFAPTVENWLEWARPFGIDERVCSFIQQNPEYLDCDNFYSEENLERTPDRRSWERTSNIIKNFQTLDENVQALLSGILGDKTAAKFMEFAKEASNKLSAKFLLGNFQDYKEELEKLSFTEVVALNQDIFDFAGWYFKGKADKTEFKVFSENLILYFDLIGNKGKEFQSHFISLINAERYGDFLRFITDFVPELYKKIMDSIKD